MKQETRETIEFWMKLIGLLITILTIVSAFLGTLAASTVIGVLSGQTISQLSCFGKHK